MTTSVTRDSVRAPRIGTLNTSATRPKRAYAGSTEPTMLLHVNLPASLVQLVRNLADEERRTITSQVALLLEESPELIAYQHETRPSPTT